MEYLVESKPFEAALPALFAGPAGHPLSPHAWQFSPLVKDGRVGSEIHSLYSTAETGPGGPAAALVRYAAGAAAATHRHPGYEIIFVLDGELETDDGVYPANSLLVLEPDSTHAPRSPKGCLALVVWEQPVVRV